MSFPLRITLLLFGVMSFLIFLVFGYVYFQLEGTYTRQSEKLMAQSSGLIQQRIELLKQSLQSEMNQLSSSMFVENESALASMLADPPEYNTEVIGFADKLRRRTSLDFLRLISMDGKVLSSSPQEAAFGTQDPRSDFPPGQPALFYDTVTCLALRQRAKFGQHGLLLEGGHFLKQELERIPLQGIAIQIQEKEFETSQSTGQNPSPDSSDRKQTIDLSDYQGHPIERITVSVSMKDLVLEKQRLLRNLLWFILGSLAVCLCSGALLSLSVSRPVRVLKDAALEISAGNLETRIDVTGSGEIAQLMQAFNEMAQQLEENQKKLIQTERVAAWQEIARHLAHEIKNPLTPIRTSITNLRLSLEKAPEKFSEIFLESSESIMEEVEQLRHLADEFSRFARLPAPNRKPGNLNELIQKALVLYQGQPEISIQFSAGNIPTLSFDSTQMSEVLHNLLQNARDAIEGPGKIEVETSRDSTQWVLLSVKDTGKGMEQNVREQIFVPYFTTKAKGTGLGLAIVHRIVTEHGGTIFVESAPSQGTKVEIRLPVE